MTPDRIFAVLRETFDDHRLTRKETRALRKLLDTEHPEARALWRHHAFELARQWLADHPPVLVIEWLEQVNKALANKPDQTNSEAYFSPGDKPRERIVRALRGAQHSADVCVFTITDNQISKVVLDTHQRGIDVRIITDNDKSEDRGSDIARLAQAGIPVRMDVTDHHMHHKFALFDERLLLTGSYNWTRSAAAVNQENILLTDEPALVARFHGVFDALWEECEPWA